MAQAIQVFKEDDKKRLGSMRETHALEIRQGYLIKAVVVWDDGTITSEHIKELRTHARN